MAAVIAFAVGAIMLWVGYRSWKFRNMETISLIEAAILQTTGAEPLPRNGTDKAVAYFQAGMGFLLGPFFMAVGMAALFL